MNVFLIVLAEVVSAAGAVLRALSAATAAFSLSLDLERTDVPARAAGAVRGRKL